MRLAVEAEKTKATKTLKKRGARAGELQATAAHTHR
jgi:hypothetical protein